MRLRGIEFGSVFNAAGARNFFGEGYWFHKILRPVGLNYTGSTFVAKTTTLDGRVGNMPVGRDFVTPTEWFPRCIIVKHWQGVVLNAVGLTGPGAHILLMNNEWQQWPEPFVISFMAVGKTVSERADEMGGFVTLLDRHLPKFRAPVALQINFSCPNVDLNTAHLTREAAELLYIAGELRLPLIPKFSATIPPETVCRITEHPNCDAICVSNTIPWGCLPDRIDWYGIFKSHVSPLQKRGVNQSGGLSGKPLLPIVCDWIQHARRAGLGKPIIGCGGILSRSDVNAMHESGASAIELGAISLLRPLRIRRLIRHANQKFANLFPEAKADRIPSSAHNAL